MVPSGRKRRLEAARVSRGGVGPDALVAGEVDAVDGHHVVVVEAGRPRPRRPAGASGAANASCRSREIEKRACSCSLHSPSEAVHSAGIRSLTSRQPRVVDTAVTLPAGNPREGLGSTHGARVIDSTPPATTTSASPVSMLREPSIAASRDDPQSRFDGAGRHRRGQAGQQDRHPPDVAVVLTRAVGAAPRDVVDGRRVEVGRCGEHAGQGGRGEVVGTAPPSAPPKRPKGVRTAA